MIAEILPKANLEYLLGTLDSAKRFRPSELIEGNLPSLIEATKIAAKYKSPFLSVAYHDKERTFEQVGGEEFEQKLKDDILETFLPRLDKSQFHYAFVRHHNEDGGYELNFHLVKMAKDRQFTPYWDAKDRNLHSLLSRKLHQENPQLSNPWEIEYEHLIYPAKQKLNSGSKIAEELEELLNEALKKKLIKDRVDFLKLIQQQGYEIHRRGKNYFSVRKDGKSIRFSGQAAAGDFDPKNIKYKPKIDTTDYAAKWREACERKHNQLTKKYKFLDIYEERTQTNDRQTTGAVSEQNSCTDYEIDGIDDPTEDIGIDRIQDGGAGCEELPTGTEIDGDGQGIARLAESIMECQTELESIPTPEPVGSRFAETLRRGFANIAQSIAASFGGLIGKILTALISDDEDDPLLGMQIDRRERIKSQSEDNSRYRHR